MKKKIFISINMIAILSIVLLNLVYSLFYEQFYIYNKSKQLDRVGKEIISIYESNGNKITNDLKEELFNDVVDKNIFSVLFNRENGKIIFSLEDYRDYVEPDVIKQVFSQSSMKQGDFIDIEQWNKAVDYETPNYVVRMNRYMLIINHTQVGENYQLIMLTYIDQQDYMATTKWFLQILSIVILIGAVSLSFFITRRINLSLALFTEQVTQLGEMNFSDIPEDKGPKEIRKLSKAYNEMNRKLESTIIALNKSNKQLEKELNNKIKLEAIRKQFISDVSHELKTPITIIENSSEALMDGVGDAGYYKNAISEEVRRMGILVEDLLELSRLESDGYRIKKEDINLDSLVEEQVELLQEVWEDKQIRLDLTEVKMEGDIHRIERLVRNSINNSAAHGYGKDIFVKLYCLEDKAILEVANESEALDSEQLERIFDRFYKRDQSRTRNLSGSGLGLSIIKEIVEKHQGSCEVFYDKDLLTFRYIFQKK